MVGIETLLKTAKGGFVDVFSPSPPPPDGCYLEGALGIRDHKGKFLGEEYWDDIEPVWWEFIDAVLRFASTGTSTMDFPDMPVSLRLRSHGNGFLRCDVEPWGAGRTHSRKFREGEFIGAVVREGSPRYADCVS
ncbi:hypothetical protein FHX37_2848 [Haloactinospora alba]|uniref:Uncharacterized protein n=1 Tax=Haloactinospora alba TaxID=405555 RepID=A0A543NM18_9ACTN|nr:hypothetical protein [Haloactinospora alba]TQN32862.1 hypothetical protein FHX37_2848 [Haloactinospora alba]